MHYLNQADDEDQKYLFGEIIVRFFFALIGKVFGSNNF